MADNKKKPDSQVEKLKIPPHSIEAEQSVLGSMLIAPDSWDKVTDIVIEEDFYMLSHRTIYGAILKLLAASQPVDVITVSEYLDQHDKLDEAGGLAYLGDLANNTPSASNVVSYAKIIKERAITRELIGVAHDIAEVGYHPEGRDSSEILDLAESKVFEIAEKRTGQSEGPQNVGAVLGKTVERLDALVKSNKDVTGVSTGFTDLDKKTSGMQPSDLIIVAARPSMGKCIVSGSKVIDPTTGALKTIDELVAKQNATVLAINNAYKTQTAKVSHFVDDGLKPVFKVTTALGKNIETTLTHPFLTGAGWQPLSKIQVGEQVAIPRSLPFFGHTSPAEHEVKALGYIVSDGSTRGTSPKFTNVNKIIADDFIGAMSQFNGVSVKAIKAKNRAQSYRVVAKNSQSELLRKRFASALSQCLVSLKITARALAQTLELRPSTISQWQNAHALPSPTVYPRVCEVLGEQFKADTERDWQSGSVKFNSVTDFLTNHGLRDKLAHEKVLPECVFEWDRTAISVLLNRMFACDGSAFTQKNGQSRISYASSSESLAKQVQHLLLRFGIVAKLRQKATKYKGAQAQFEVEIMGQTSLIIFIEQIGILGKQDAIDSIFANIKSKRSHSNVDSVPLSVNEYILQLKGNDSWSNIFSKAKQAYPAGFHPHLKGVPQRHLSRDRVQFFANLFDDKYLQDMAKSDIYWDKVVSIEYLGYKQVYDLTVPEYHNFVAQDFFVHNTTFAMNLAENAMMMEDKPVLVFSLEMPAEQIMMRMLASLSRVDQTKIRTAQLDEEDWARMSNTMAQLKDKDNLYIDDSSGLTPMDVRSRARKLARERGGIAMIMIDYLQLMRVPALSDNRTLEIAEISRSLKALAKELNVPVIALSQLNRTLEQRADKRPVNSDLRECVVGSTLVQLADGTRRSIDNLVEQTMHIVSPNPLGKLEHSFSDKVWVVGKKPVFTVETESGRKITCSAQHKLLALSGWQELHTLEAGMRLALPRRLPQPEQTVRMAEHEIIFLAHMIGDGSYVKHQPMRYTTASEANSEAVRQAAVAFGNKVNRREGRGNWHQLEISGNGNRWHPQAAGKFLKELGIYGQRSHDKHIPDCIFKLDNNQLALFLRHLWATDGSTTVVRVFFSTASEKLVNDVASLLLRFGIVSRISHKTKDIETGWYELDISGKESKAAFIEHIGGFGHQTPAVQELQSVLHLKKANTNVDTVLIEIFDYVKDKMAEQGISQRKMASLRGTSYGGTSHFRFAPSRDVLHSYAEILDDDNLRQLASSDLFWDRIKSITPAGEEMVYDLTVPGNAAWIANGIVSHNSGAIEQDADLIMFIYRDEVYHENSEEKGIAEIIIGKQRNGPIGTSRLVFQGQFSRFDNYAGPEYGDDY